MGMFDHLKQYVKPSPHSEHDVNFFCPVPPERIILAEKQMGSIFPSQLRLFFHEIGCGFLRKSRTNTRIVTENFNRILAPGSVVKVMNGLSDLAPSDGFKPGEMPFIEVAEGWFFVFRYKSAHPNSVYTPTGTVLAHDFSEFMNKLHDDPNYYLNVSPNE